MTTVAGGSRSPGAGDAKDCQCHVNAGNWIWVVPKSTIHSSPLDCHFMPPPQRVILKQYAQNAAYGNINEW